MINFDQIIQSLEKEPVEDKQFTQLLDFIIQELFPGGEYRLIHDPHWYQYILKIRHEGKYYESRARDEQIGVIRGLQAMVKHCNLKQLKQ